MDPFKIIVGIAIGIISVIVFLFAFLKNPEEVRFHETLELIMKQENLSSREEVMYSFPQLETVAIQLDRIGQLQSNIQRISGGPAPNMSQDELLEMQASTHEIHRLRKSINQELEQFKSNYRKD
ncbi:MAG: hypothetical protein KTR22_05045 [Flavobacteriaceae bacterium]|nr:hypothetical protein [Flavobacteriaceae bacterium]